MEPDQIDMMDEKELRIELRKLIEQKESGLPSAMGSKACWISAADRLPDVGCAKCATKGWLVWDGEREYYTTVHPGNWNVAYDYDDGSKSDLDKVILWLDAPPAQDKP